MVRMDEINNAAVSEEQIPKVWKLKGTLAFGFLAFVVFSVIQAIAYGMFLGASHGQLSDDEFDSVAAMNEFDGDGTSATVLASFFICIPLLFALVKLKRGATIKEYFSLKGASSREYLFWVGNGVLLLAGIDVITYFLGKEVVPQVMVDVYASAQYTWLFIFCIVVAGPVFEELFFRGFFFIGLENSSIGKTGAILFTSFIWAIIHIQYDWFGIGVIFVLGIWLGLARLKTQSIYVPIVLHVVNNLIATLLMSYVIYR